MSKTKIIIGLIAGIVSGTGMGGGTVLILLLSLILGLEQHVAQASNLIFFIPTSIVAIFENFRNKLIDKNTALIVSGFGIIGAIIGAIISTRIEVNFLKKLFGIFLALIASFEIISYFKLYIFRKERDNK